MNAPTPSPGTISIGGIPSIVSGISPGLTVGGIGVIGSSGNYGSYNITDLSSNSNRLNNMFDNSELTFSIIKANGGYVVRCGNSNNSPTSVYIIPDTKKNFDRELGKIISMHLLKG